MNRKLNINILVILLVMLTRFSMLSGQKNVLADTILNFDHSISLSFKPEIISTENLLIAPKYDHKVLPFFCKMEHLIESNSKIAFRFRLGDLNYVNLLENKR